MEDAPVYAPPLDSGTHAASEIPVSQAPVPTPGEDEYMFLLNSSIDSSDPILSGTRPSSWNSLCDLIQNQQSV